MSVQGPQGGCSQNVIEANRFIRVNGKLGDTPLSSSQSRCDWAASTASAQPPSAPVRRASSDASGRWSGAGSRGRLPAQLSPCGARASQTQLPASVAGVAREAPHNPILPSQGRIGERGRARGAAPLRAALAGRVRVCRVKSSRLGRRKVRVSDVRHLPNCEEAAAAPSQGSAVTPAPLRRV